MFDKIRKLERSLVKKRKNTFFNLHFTYPIASVITFFLVKTPITPNQITILMIIFGIVGASLLYFGGYVAIIGSVLLLLHYFLDAVDGRVARYKKIESFVGRFLDLICHNVVEPLIFLILALRFAGTNTILFTLSLFAVLFTFLLRSTHITKKSIIAEQMIKGKLKKSQVESEMLQKTRSALQNIFGKTIGLLYRPGESIFFLLIATIFNRIDIYLYFYGFTLPFIATVRTFVVFRYFKRFDKK